MPNPKNQPTFLEEVYLYLQKMGLGECPVTLEQAKEISQLAEKTALEAVGEDVPEKGDPMKTPAVWHANTAYNVAKKEIRTNLKRAFSERGKR